MESVAFVAYVGDDLDLIIAVDEWRKAHPGVIEHVDCSDGGVSLEQTAGEMSLFSPHRQIIAEKVDSCDTALLGRVADACGDALHICATANKLRSGKFTIHKLDRTWKAAQTRKLYADCDVRVGKDARTTLTELTAGNLLRLRNILTVASLAGLGELTSRQARLLNGTNSGATAGWDIADALFADNPARAITAAERAEAIPALAYLTSHVASLIVAKESGDDSSSLAKRLGIAPWMAKRLVQRARGATLDTLYMVLRVLCDGDIGARGEQISLTETVARTAAALQPVEMRRK